MSVEAFSTVMEFNRNPAHAPSLSREAELLIACGATCASDQPPGSIEDLAATRVDWDLFLRMACGHGMSSIAERALAAHTKLVPVSIMADLHMRRVSVMARDLYLANELLTVVELLEKGGVRALAFKGPSLGALAYRETGMREFSDLDILVAPAARSSARQTLIAHGYRPKCLDQRVIESPIFQCIEEPFVAADGVTLVDLHWRMLPRYSNFPADDLLWQRARPIMLRRRPVTTLAVEDLLLFLCLHGAKHGWPLLSWICDLAGLIARSASQGFPIDWQVLNSRAESINSRRSLLLGLGLAHNLMNAAVPSDLTAEFRADAIASSLAQRVIRAMFRNFGDRRGLSQELIIPLQSLESSREKIRYLAGRAFTPTLDDWLAMPLRAAFFPLFYLTRPLRLGFAQASTLRRK